MVNKDQVAGKVKELGGAARRKIAEVTNDKEGQARGAADEITGSVQKGYGDVKNKLG